MAIYKRRDVQRVLKRKFSFAPSENDHSWYHLVVDGAVIAATFVASGGHGGDIDDSLQLLMARELHLDKVSEFRRAIDCPMTREEYYKRLAKRNPQMSQQILDAIGQ